MSTPMAATAATAMPAMIQTAVGFGSRGALAGERVETDMVVSSGLHDSQWRFAW